MFTLPVLPDELRITLDEVKSGDVVVCKYPGVVAVVKPLDVLTASKWNDQYPDLNERSVAATMLVFEQLVRIEGLTMRDADGNEVPFDKENPAHKRSMPMDMRSGIYVGLRERASVSGELEKN